MTSTDIDRARGDRITEAMSRRGLRYNCQLSYDIGVSESTLSRWRKGLPLSLRHAIALSCALQISLDYLLVGSDDAALASFDAQVSQFCQIYMRLDDQHRELSLRLLRSLAAQSIGTRDGNVAGPPRPSQFSVTPLGMSADGHALDRPKVHTPADVVAGVGDDLVLAGSRDLFCW
jgi:transcriptional regulator with XRE-family HTH domain